MDNSDTHSNCSENSVSIKSNLSSVSGLSSYRNEFAELRHLIHPEKYADTLLDRSSTPKQDEGYVSYDHNVFNLTEALHKSQLTAERYKLDLNNLEKKIELKYCEKIDTLLRNNTRLQVQLENSNIQVDRLLNKYNKNDNVELDKRYHDILSQNHILQKDCADLKNENSSFELEIKNLKVALNEYMIDNKANNSCIVGLKQKIVSQQVAIQNHLKNNNLTNNILNEIQGELEQVKKSRDWYKEQFHECQNEKQNFSKIILELKHTISIQNNQIELLNIEIEKQDNKCDEIKLLALKEKENLLKRFEQYDVAVEKAVSVPFTDDVLIDNNSLEYQFIIEDLTQKLSSIKVELERNFQNNEKLTKENAELLSKYLITQKNIQQYEADIASLECEKKNLIKSIADMYMAEKQRSTEILQLKNEKINLQTQVSSLINEKEIVDNSIKIIRTQFLKFKDCYNKVRDDLQRQNNQILVLQNEKQDLFMKNNWTVCELEKSKLQFKEKDLLVNKLKTDVAFLESEIKNLLEKVKSLEIEISLKEEAINKNCKESQKYEGVLSQYKDLTMVNEVKIKQLNKRGEEYEEIIKNLKVNVVELEEAVKHEEDKMKQLENEYNSNIECINVEKQLLLEENTRLLKSTASQQSIIENMQSKIHSENKICENCMPYPVAKLFSNGSKFPAKLNSIFCDKLILNAIQSSIFKFEENFNLSLYKINDKINGLSIRNANCCEKLWTLLKGQNNIAFSGDHEILKDLRVQLKVKELELKEKQKKYDANNRTLLRKVKEHMRGRNLSEKHNRQLQELYNALSNENNTIKLDISSKMYEIEDLKRLTENYKNVIEKLKETVLNLEKELANRPSICEKCLEFNDAKEKLDKVENDLKIFEEEKNTLTDNLHGKENKIIDLHQKICSLRLEKTNLSLENNKKSENITLLNDKLNMLTCEMSSHKSIIDSLNVECENEREKYREVTKEKMILSEQLELKSHELKNLNNQIEILSLDLHQKTEEILRLEENKHKSETIYVKKEADIEKTVADLKQCLETTQNEMSIIENEKHFLQRLCKDLKIALRTHINQNNVLRDQLRSLEKSNSDSFNSLPNGPLPDLPISSQYDEEFVNSLLEKKTPKNKLIPNELQNHLNNLRKEIFALQEEIIKKNAKR